MGDLPMPAQRLKNQPVTVRKYDVAAQDSASTRCFVGHVGLAPEQRSHLRWNDEIGSVHMKPPLQRSQSGFAVHAVGTAGLTSDEIRQIDVFVDELEDEYEADKRRHLRQYVIHPHTEPVLATDGTIICRRFSCAGFVIEAYRDAGIMLLSTTVDDLPSVSLDTLKRAYHDFRERLDRPDERKRYGLSGDGPWPVLLAGYVLNAFDRSENEIRATPYKPRSGDEFFPSKRAVR